MDVLSTLDLTSSKASESTEERLLIRRMNQFSLKTVFTSTRYVLAFLAAAGFFLAFSNRIILSVALVDMVSDSGAENNATDNNNCPVNRYNSTQSSEGNFDVINFGQKL